MIRAVVDVNVLISALVGPLGFSRRVLEAWKQAQFDLIVSDGIVEELGDKLSLRRIRKLLRLREQAGIEIVSPREFVEILETEQTTGPNDDPS
jgi:predicted nucleic acid-binding protein